MLVSGVVCDEHFLHASELGCGLRHRRAALAGDQHMHRAADGGCGGEGLVRDAVQRLVVMFRDQQRGHQITPASLSLPTSSLAEPTLTPALRPPGSTVFRTVRRGLASTPSPSGVFSSIGFFFAFMMLGSDA